MNERLETLRGYSLVLCDLINRMQDGDDSRGTRNEFVAVIDAQLRLGVALATEIALITRKGDLVDEY